MNNYELMQKILLTLMDNRSDVTKDEEIKKKYLRVKKKDSYYF